jgi:hypothetical protein
MRSFSSWPWSPLPALRDCFSYFTGFRASRATWPCSSSGFRFWRLPGLPYWGFGCGYRDPREFRFERRDAPGLWTTIAELERDLRTPRVGRVHLTDQFNAALGHYPRFGLLGWHYSVLFLGMPWLLASSPDRVRAVIAHELAHLSRRHNWTTRLVWRARASAERVQTTIATAYHPSHFLTARFFSWYRPALERRAMALSRTLEFEADRLAAEVAGFDLVGEALLELRICDSDVKNRFE